MKLRIILLFVAIIIAVGAVIAVLFYIDSIRSSVEEEVEKVEVLVAVKNIPKETSVEQIISGKGVESQYIPRKYLADGVLTSLNNFKGYVASVAINMGEQITSTNFIRPEEIGLAFMIPEEMIAMSIPVNEVIGVSNLIRAGDRVNVIATLMIPEEQAAMSIDEVSGVEEDQSIEAPGLESFIDEGKEAEKSEMEIITKTILWNVEVIYVGTEITVTMKSGPSTEILSQTTQTQNIKSPEINTITLALTPEESEKLVFIEEIGSVWLALVPTDVIGTEKTSGRTLDNIFE